jgi:1-deoxy-D-xylulose-5-phosphate synthase
MLWEEMGFRYVGPVDGHDIQAMTRYLELLKNVKGPVLLHVLTEKGHGFQPACADPVKYHAPAPFSRTDDNEIVPIKAGKKKTPAYTNLASDAIYEVMKRDARACVLTAAMCTGNDLGKVRSEFPDRFFDTGITEGHAVAFAAGMAKTGMRPVVDIYSTFLQPSFDQIFQEVALQNLPVTFALDRAGLCGPDGPTHHGVFDNTYMRTFPNMVVMAPGDARDVAPMFDFAIRREGPTSLRYPKTSVEDVERNVAAIELGKAEIHRSGADGVLIAYGTLFPTCVKAADELRKHGLEVGVINARFAKPIDSEAILKAVSESGFVITIEESTICGGFGSAVLEACNENGVSTTNITRLGIPDRFMEHGERGELLASIGMDLNGIVAKSLELAGVKQDSDAVAVC